MSLEDRRHAERQRATETLDRRETCSYTQIMSFRDYELARKRLQGPMSFSFTVKVVGGAVAGKAAAAALAITVMPTAQAPNAMSEVDVSDPDYEYAPIESYSPFDVVSSATANAHWRMDYMLPDGFWKGSK